MSSRPNAYLGVLSESHLKSSAFQPPYAGTFMCACIYVCARSQDRPVIMASHIIILAARFKLLLRSLPMHAPSDDSGGNVLSLTHTHALIAPQPFPRTAPRWQISTAQAPGWLSERSLFICSACSDRLMVRQIAYV
jgi:hypothetical protein